MKNKLTMLVLLIFVTTSISLAQVTNITHPGTGPYATIQDAINNAATVSGDVLNVAAGIYTENVNITKSLTLQSASGASSTTIIANTANGTTVAINADNVTIDGFKITNPSGYYGISSANHSGIVIQNNTIDDIGSAIVTPTGNIFGVVISGTTTAMSGITIQNNTISKIYGGSSLTVGATGIVMGFTGGSSTVTGLSIQNNNISDIKASITAKGAYGIFINYGGTTLAPSILNNTISALDGYWAHAIGLEGNTPNAVVQNNSINNVIDHKSPTDAAAVMIEDNTSANTVAIHLNNFTNVLLGVRNATALAIDAEQNYWGDNNPSDNVYNTGGGSIDYSPWLSTDPVGDPHTTPWTWNVDNSDGGNAQEAINAALAGDIVNIPSGTYTHLNITTSLTINGNGALITNASPAITVSANNVTITGLAFNYAGTDEAIRINAGVTGTIIHDCNFNVTNAINNLSASAVNAEYNYWGYSGHFTGPTIASNVGGTGSVITDAAAVVDYDPWVGKTTTPSNSATAVATSGLTITWDWLNYFGPNFIFQLDHNGVAGSDVNTTVATNSYAVATTLLNNTTYHWYVRSAADPLNVWIGPFSFTTVLGAPTAIAATSITTTSFSANWTANTYGGATSYILRVGTTSGGTNIVSDVNVGNVLTYSVTGLTPNTTYYYSVKATDGVNTTASSNEITTAAKPLPPTFASPSPANYAVGVSILPSFAWTGATNATGYEFQVSTVSDFSTTITLNPAYATPATTYSFAYSSTANLVLNNNTLYYWRVRQTTPQGTSDWIQREFRTVAAAVPTISTLYAYSASVSLGWYPYPYATGITFDVLLSTNSDMSSYTIVYSGTDVTNTILTNLLPGQQYYLQIVAYTGSHAVYYSYSTKSTFTMPGLPMPYLSWPVGGTTVYTNPPILSWYTGTYDATYSYVVKYWKSGQLEPTITTAQSNLSGYFATGTGDTYLTLTATLDAGATYYWRVATTNDGGTTLSAFSTTGSFAAYGVTAATAPRPYASYPTGGTIVYLDPPTLYWYTGTYTTGLKFYAEWSTSSSVAGGDNHFSSPEGNSGWIDDLYFTLPTAIMPGTPYYWHVYSSLDGGVTKSNPSTVTSFRIASTAIGGAPQPIPSYPTGGVTVTSPLASTTLNWTAYSTAALYYDLIISPNSSTDSYGVLNHATITTVNNISGESIVVPITLTAGATYYWQVRSKLQSNTSIVSSWSYVVSFVTAAGSSAIVPLAVSPNYGQPINATSTILNWSLPTKSSSYLSYEVQYSKESDFKSYSTLKDIGENITSVSDLEPNTTYYWRVLSKNNSGTSSYSETATFRTNSTTDVQMEEEVIPTSFELSQNYPNPFNPTTRINFALPQSSYVTVKIFDMLGQEIRTLISEEMNAGVHSTNWNGENNLGRKVASGTYIYRISAGNFVSTKKMVLMK